MERWVPVSLYPRPGFARRPVFSASARLRPGRPVRPVMVIGHDLQRESCSTRAGITRSATSADSPPTEDQAITALAIPTSEPAAPPAGAEYRELKRRVTAAGLLRPRPGYYATLIAANLALVAGLVVLLAVFGPGWPAAVIAAALGFAAGQLGFQLHDAGHRQMFGSRALNSAIGFVTGNLLLGMSHGWWVDKHNRHHGNPNHVDLDPDIKIGVVSYSTEQALAKRGLARRIAAHQAYLFFPLLFGLAWAMHASSASYLIAQRTRAAAVEGVALVLHFVLFLALLVALVGPVWAIAVAAIQISVGGLYMALVFAPNHKGMPQVDGERIDFLRAQVLTSRNVRSHPVTDFLYGGLNYQIEHHLFPTMPRCNVRRAHAIVRDYCREVGIPYHEVSIAQSYREILGFLHEVGAPLRAVGAAAA